MRNKALIAFLSVLSISVCCPQTAILAQKNPQNLGSIKPSNLQVPSLATFASDSIAQQIASTVARDLDMADMASQTVSETALSAAHAAEAQNAQGGDPKFAAWAATGATYLLRVRGNGSSYDAELFNTVSKTRLMGKKYSGNSTLEIAHKIADDSMTALSTWPGIFSSKIAFVSGRKNLIVADADGNNAKTVASDNILLATPTWGDGGRELYFTGYSDNNPDLFAVTLSGSKRIISSTGGLNSSPAWSQKAGRIALCMSKDGNSEIYTMSKGGFFSKRLTFDPGVDTAPAWDPTGTQIAYTSDRSGTPQIYIMSSSGAGQQRISIGAYCDSASWSPDGKRLAYVVREKGGFNIYYADLTTGELTQLTSSGKNEDPSWGPSSNHIIFSRDSSLYMMNINTKKAKRIGNLSGTQPVWGPLLN